MPMISSMPTMNGTPMMSGAQMMPGVPTMTGAAMMPDTLTMKQACMNHSFTNSDSIDFNTNHCNSIDFNDNHDSDSVLPSSSTITVTPTKGSSSMMNYNALDSDSNEEDSSYNHE